MKKYCLSDLILTLMVCFHYGFKLRSTTWSKLFKIQTPKVLFYQGTREVLWRSPSHSSSWEFWYRLKHSLEFFPYCIPTIQFPYHSGSPSTRSINLAVKVAKSICGRGLIFLAHSGTFQSWQGLWLHETYKLQSNIWSSLISLKAPSK